MGEEIEVFENSEKGSYLFSPKGNQALNNLKYHYEVLSQKIKQLEKQRMQLHENHHSKVRKIDDKLGRIKVVDKEKFRHLSSFHLRKLVSLVSEDVEKLETQLKRVQRRRKSFRKQIDQLEQKQQNYLIEKQSIEKKSSLILGQDKVMRHEILDLSKERKLREIEHLNFKSQYETFLEEQASMKATSDEYLNLIKIKKKTSRNQLHSVVKSKKNYYKPMSPVVFNSQQNLFSQAIRLAKIQENEIQNDAKTRSRSGSIYQPTPSSPDSQSPVGRFTRSLSMSKIDKALVSKVETELQQVLSMIGDKRREKEDITKNIILLLEQSQEIEGKYHVLIKPYQRFASVQAKLSGKVDAAEYEFNNADSKVKEYTSKVLKLEYEERSLKTELLQISMKLNRQKSNENLFQNEVGLSSLDKKVFPPSNSLDTEMRKDIKAILKLKKEYRKASDQYKYINGFINKNKEIVSQTVPILRDNLRQRRKDILSEVEQQKITQIRLIREKEGKYLSLKREFEKKYQRKLPAMINNFVSGKIEPNSPLQRPDQITDTKTNIPLIVEVTPKELERYHELQNRIEEIQPEKKFLKEKRDQYLQIRNRVEKFVAGKEARMKRPITHYIGSLMKYFLSQSNALQQRKKKLIERRDCVHHEIIQLVQQKARLLVQKRHSHQSIDKFQSLIKNIEADLTMHALKDDQWNKDLKKSNSVLSGIARKIAHLRKKTKDFSFSQNAHTRKGIIDDELSQNTTQLKQLRLSENEMIEKEKVLSKQYKRCLLQLVTEDQGKEDRTLLLEAKKRLKEDFRIQEESIACELVNLNKQFQVVAEKLAHTTKLQIQVLEHHQRSASKRFETDKETNGHAVPVVKVEKKPLKSKKRKKKKKSVKRRPKWNPYG